MKIRIADYVTEPILLSNRFGYPQKPILRLNKIQRKILNKFEKAIRDEELEFVAVDCRCGRSRDMVLSQVDRYGLWVRTVLCQNCGLIRTNPRLNSESLATFYKRFYRPLYSGLQQTNDALFLSQANRGNQILDLVVAKCNLKRGVVFDVGTGAGGTLFPFLQAGWRVTGVDVGSQCLDYGRSKGLILHKGSFDFFINRGLQADLLILCHVFEHLEDLDQTVSKIRQCLKPNGFVYIEVPGIFNSLAYNNDLSMYFVNAHLYYFCLQTLSNVLRENGFELMYGTEYVRSIFRPRTDLSTTTISSASCEEIVKEILVHLKQMDSFQRRLKQKLFALMHTDARRLGVRALEITRLKEAAKNLLHKT